ncbi:MAG: hypothetical protein M1118_05900 [Chloroflexi bacterium]|nr:hypothetical protein [Chloroflexota bacterium]
MFECIAKIGARKSWGLMADAGPPPAGVPVDAGAGAAEPVLRVWGLVVRVADLLPLLRCHLPQPAGSGVDVACSIGPADDHYGTLVLRGGTSGTYWELTKLRSTDPAPDGFALLFVTGSTSTPVLVATTAGQLGIGTVTPSKPLEVAGGAVKLAGGIVFGPDSQGGVPGMHSDGTNLYLEANAGSLYLRPQGEGDNTNAAVLTSDGSLGIGTLTPSHTLHVHGADASGSGILVDTAGYTNLPPTLGTATGVVLNARGLNVVADGAALAAGPSAGVGIAVNRAGSALGLRNSTGPALVVETGSVGIGTATPQQPLDVAGTVRCTGILLGGDELLSGAIKDSTGQYTRVDAGGCFYAS